MKVYAARTETGIAACFSAMSELRSHLEKNTFVTQVQRQIRNHGHELVYIASPERVVAIAGIVSLNPCPGDERSMLTISLP